MNGDNGRGSLFQSEQFKGDNNRDFKTRPELSEVEQLLLNCLRDLQNDVKSIKMCKDDCNLGELQQHVGHISDVIEEKGHGEGKTKGINNFRDQDKQIEKILDTRSKIIERALLILVGVGIYYVAKKMGWA